MQSSQSPNILIVEDVPSLAESYAAYLRNECKNIAIAGDGQAALAFLEASPPDLVLLDVNLPDMSGIEILQKMRADGIASEVIVITGEGSIRLAVDAMRFGASDFLVKPFAIERLRAAVRLALENGRAPAPRALASTDLNVCASDGTQAAEATYPQTESAAATAPPSVGDLAGVQPPAHRTAAGRANAPAGRFAGFIGNSARMDSVYRLLTSAASSNATVFVTGESGTGKELCADALHRLSRRSAGPFVVINCAAIPRDLLESEIFGHVKGAFTGATSDRKGAALQANGGTLFLDEVCEMDIGLQAKLLRFLQERQVHRLGEDTPRPTDVRIVCATNRDPHAEVVAGRFREDLFYRLHVVPLELPPLRERDRDVLLIARYFLERFAREDAKSLRTFTPECEAALLAYSWPGNVRQLQNVVRSIVVLNDGGAVTADMLPPQVRGGGEASCLRNPPAAALQFAPAALSSSAALSDGAIKPLERVIRETIEQAIDRCGGSIPKAAAALTVSPSTLYRRIQAWQADGAQT